MRRTAGRITAAAYLFLSIYVLGCLVVENDVGYPAWAHIDAASFTAFHQQMQRGLEVAMFAPMTVHLVAGVALLVLGAPFWPRWLIAVAVGLDLYLIVESLLVQVPIHEALEVAKTPALIDRLISTHRMFRLPAQLASAVVAAVMLWRMTRPTPAPASVAT